MEREFADYFDFKKFSPIWEAFYVSNQHLIPQPSAETPYKVRSKYFLDKLIYRTEMWVHLFDNQDTSEWPGIYFDLKIKLHNDRYFYKPHDLLKINQDNSSTQDSRGWCSLDLAVYEEYFAPLLDFGKRYFQLIPGYNHDVSFLVSCHYENRRVDVKGFAPSVNHSFTISFTPGYPEESDLKYAVKRNRASQSNSNTLE